MYATEGELGSLARPTTSRGQDAIPAWSPDGTKDLLPELRESTAERNRNLEIFTMNPNGTDVTPSPRATTSPVAPDPAHRRRGRAHGAERGPTPVCASAVLFRRAPPERRWSEISR
jgi:hypothetical protein